MASSVEWPIFFEYFCPFLLYSCQLLPNAATKAARLALVSLVPCHGGFGARVTGQWLQNGAVLTNVNVKSEHQQKLAAEQSTESLDIHGELEPKLCFVWLNHIKFFFGPTFPICTLHSLAALHRDLLLSKQLNPPQFALKSNIKKAFNWKILFEHNMFAEREYYDRLTAGSNENSSNKEKYEQCAMYVRITVLSFVEQVERACQIDIQCLGNWQINICLYFYSSTATRELQRSNTNCAALTLKHSENWELNTGGNAFLARKGN